MAEASYYASPTVQPGTAAPQNGRPPRYDYASGRWIDPTTGNAVAQPGHVYYGLDGNSQPFATSDGMLSDEYNQAHAESLAALQRATTVGPGGRGMSSAELDRIKQAIGFNDNPSLPTTGPSAGQEEAARASAFARAKDTAGAIARSSLTALRNTLNARGVTGTDYETGKDAAVIGGAANSVGEENNQQLQSDLASAQHKADLTYQYQDAVNARKSASMNSLLSIINSRGGLY